MTAKSIVGRWFQRKPTCCSLEPNRVIDPVPIERDSGSDSELFLKDKNNNYKKLGEWLVSQDRYDYYPQCSAVKTLRQGFMPSRSCEKYYCTLDDGSMIHYTRKEYERQVQQDKKLKEIKKKEKSEKKATSHLFRARKNKVHIDNKVSRHKADDDADLPGMPRGDTGSTPSEPVKPTESAKPTDSGPSTPALPPPGWRPDLSGGPKTGMDQVKIDLTNVTVGHTPSQPYNPESETIVSFMDNEAAEAVGGVAGNHVFSTTDGNSTDIDLSKWLERPTLINTMSWSTADVTGIKQTLQPHFLFLNSQPILNKVTNYSWYRSDLKIRIQVTASPFYYGMLKVVWRPQIGWRGDTAPADASQKYLIQISQFPCMDIVLGEADAYEMTIPYINHKNYSNLQSANVIKELGNLEFYVYAPLQSANGVSTSAVTVKTFAWTQNCELSGASAGYALQSDEYGEGAISKPASWLAKAASYFTTIPIIGEYATATMIGAGAISNIARLFGYTNVPVIADTQPMRNEAFPKLASTEIGFPVEKLTIDPKNELSVDPRIIGLNSGLDEMAFSHIIGKESYLCSASWSTSDSEDSMLFYSRVNPNMFDIDTATHPRVFMTPMCHLARAFQDWRGSIKFRFHVVASQYHKGKIYFSYDPSGSATSNVGVVTGSSNLVHTTILDIGESKDITITIPYQQASQFISSRSSYIGTKNWGTNTSVPTYNTFYDGASDNGVITMRVLNTLTAPVASSNVKVLVYVSGGNDMEFAAPVNLGDTSGVMTLFEPQSEEFSENVPTDEIVMAPTASIPEKQYVVHYGENIRSLRMLLRRYSLLQTESFLCAGLGQHGWMTKTIYRTPISPGFTSASTTLANKIVGTGNAGYNFCAITPLSYFSAAYLCYRGSTNWTFNTDSNINQSSFFAFRDPYATNASGLLSTIATYSGMKSIMTDYYTNAAAGSAGLALTNLKIQPGLNIANPFYSKYKYAYCTAVSANTGLNGDASVQSNVKVRINFPAYNLQTVGIQANSCLLATYVAAGTDYGLYFYQCAPAVWIQTIAVQMQ